MFDRYGDLYVFSEDKDLDPHLIHKLIGKGAKNIFTRTAFCKEERIFEVKWQSPFERKKFSTRYLHCENNILLYGDLCETYYSPRYASERLEICKLIKIKGLKKVTIVGSGISPLGILLVKNTNCDVIEYQINPRATHFGLINQKINRVENVLTKNQKYQNQPSQCIISIIPTKGLDFHKIYNFEKLAIVYVLLDYDQIQNFESELKNYYHLKIIHSTIARRFSKYQNIYRICMEK